MAARPAAGSAVASGADAVAQVVAAAIAAGSVVAIVAAQAAVVAVARVGPRPSAHVPPAMALVALVPPRGDLVAPRRMRRVHPARLVPPAKPPARRNNR